MAPTIHHTLTLQQRYGDCSESEVLDFDTAEQVFRLRSHPKSRSCGGTPSCSLSLQSPNRSVMLITPKHTSPVITTKFRATSKVHEAFKHASAQSRFRTPPRLAKAGTGLRENSTSDDECCYISITTDLERTPSLCGRIQGVKEQSVCSTTQNTTRERLSIIGNVGLDLPRWQFDAWMKSLPVSIGCRKRAQHESCKKILAGVDAAFGCASSNQRLHDVDAEQDHCPQIELQGRTTTTCSLDNSCHSGAGHEGTGPSPPQNTHRITYSYPGASGTGQCNGGSSDRSLSDRHTYDSFEPGGGNGGEPNNTPDVSDIPQNLAQGFRCVVHGHQLPEERADCGSNKPVSSVSQLRPHHESHDFFYCLKCFEPFDSETTREDHESTGCHRICVTPDCRNFGNILRHRPDACDHRKNAPIHKWLAISRLYHERVRPNLRQSALGANGQLAPRRRPRAVGASSRTSRPAQETSTLSITPTHPGTSEAERLLTHTEVASLSATGSSLPTRDPEALLRNVVVMCRITSSLAMNLIDRVDLTDERTDDVIEDLHNETRMGLRLVSVLFANLRGGSETISTALEDLPSEHHILARTMLDSQEMVGPGSSATHQFQNLTFPPERPAPSPVSSAERVTVPGLGTGDDDNEIAYVGMASFAAMTPSPTSGLRFAMSRPKESLDIEMS